MEPYVRNVDMDGIPDTDEELRKVPEAAVICLCLPRAYGSGTSGLQPPLLFGRAFNQDPPLTVEASEP
jgi:hypothetical protein